MPLGPQHIAPVGFVLSGGVPIGTCFVVERLDPEMEGRSDFYMVTARHVVKQKNGQNKPELSVRFREYGGDQIDTWPESRWLAHDSPEIDVAIAPFAEHPRFRIGSLRVGTQIMHLGPRDVVLGMDVFYVGLFTPADRMGAEGVPMVRSGTLGAFAVRIQPNDAPEPYWAHLIDIRSYGGFSGSPVFFQHELPTTLIKLGEMLDERNRKQGGPVSEEPKPETLEQIGYSQYATVVAGVLIIHYTDQQAPDLVSNAGVGIVVPSYWIFELLDHPDCEAERVKAREYERERAPKLVAEEASVDASEPTYTEDTFLADLRKVSKRVERPEREA